MLKALQNETTIMEFEEKNEAFSDFVKHGNEEEKHLFFERQENLNGKVE